MTAEVGAGWTIHHLTDRVVELRKDDPVYRRFTGRDGYVRTRAEPGMDRHMMVERAIKTAQRTDAELGRRVAKQLMPSVDALTRFRVKQRRMAWAFGVKGAEEQKVYRP